MHQIDYAAGQSNFLENVKHEFGGERNLFRRLQNESVSADDGERKEPHGDHGGEIEGRDGGANSNRLADGLGVDSAGHTFKNAALHGHGSGASNFDDFNRAADFGAGVGEYFARLEGDGGGEIVNALAK